MPFAENKQALQAASLWPHVSLMKLYLHDVISGLVSVAQLHYLSMTCGSSPDLIQDLLQSEVVVF